MISGKRKENLLLLIRNDARQFHLREEKGMVNTKKKLLLFITGIYILNFTAEKCREMTGEETSSQSSKFSFFDCFDMGSGTVGCAVKEGVKMYSNNLRATHIKKASHIAIEGTLAEARSRGLSTDEAAKAAQKAGTKAAKVATKEADRLIGPVASAVWDFFEAMFYGGSLNEGTVRGVGTLFGTYAGGSLGEQWLGKLGYLLGSLLGSWFGGRVGVMVYDILNAIHFIIRIL